MGSGDQSCCFQLIQISQTIQLGFGWVQASLYPSSRIKFNLMLEGQRWEDVTLKCAADQLVTFLPDPSCPFPLSVLVTLNQARIFHCGIVIRFLRPGQGPGTWASDSP